MRLLLCSLLNQYYVQYKTGGTTIRRNLERIERIDYVFAKSFSMYHDTASQVEETILHGRENNTILFYEIHATTAPSFFRLRKRLRRWRETAAQNQVPVFFFSLVREPVSYSFSHFNFFHLQKRNPSFERCNATEHDFIRKSVFNPVQDIPQTILISAILLIRKKCANVIVEKWGNI